MKIYINKMNQKLYLTISILHLFILHCISTENIQNRSNWWKEVHNSSSNVTDYVPSGTVRSLINSTISGNEYWRTNSLNRRVTNNYSETFNEIEEPESIVLPPNNGNTKIVRKIKRTFKNKTTKQTNDKPSEESINEWKENFVEPSITLDQNSLTFTTTSSPIVQLHKASTSNQLFQTTASDLDNLITSKVKWDDDNDSVPLSRSPIFKTKIGNQESIYDKYASIMPLPPPNTQSTNQQPTTQSSSTAMMIDNNQYSNENSNNNLQSSSHHSVVAPLSSSNSFFNFNSKITHSQPVSRQSEGNNKRKKQTRNTNKQKKIKNQSTPTVQPAPIQDFFLEADKIDKKVDDNHVNNLKKTVDYTSRVNHEVIPKNNLLAHMLKNNPFAIPIGKKTYKVTKKGTTSATPSPTVLTKRMQPVKYATGSTSYSSISSSVSRTNNDEDEYTTTPMTSLSNDNLDNINFKATPSKQEYTWGMRRVQASKNNLISKTNSKANQLLAKRNEWSGNDEQKDSINEKLLENTESDEESVENEENTPSNEDVESINNDVNNNELNNEFNKNLAAIRNEETPKFDVVTFKTPNSKGTSNNQVKGTLNVKSLPIQIISWRQAITHRNKGKETNDEKPFAGERITSAKLTVSNRAIVRKDQQIEREKPSPKAFSSVKLQTTKQPLSTSSKPNSSFRTTASPKLISTTRSSYNSATSTISDNQQSTNKRQQSQAGSSKSTRNPLNSFVAGRKNEAYIAPQTQQTPVTSTITKTKPAQLFQEYEDEKESFREELDDNFITNRQTDLHSSPKKENRVKYAKNQEFRKKSLNLIEDKNNDNSIENNDQTEATKPVPITGFKCTSPGYFGDLETGCTVFHICQENNRKDSFFCPPGTAFNQLLSVCDWQANVNCAETSGRPKPITNSINNSNNNAFETLNNLRNNNYESDDSIEEQKK